MNIQQKILHFVARYQYGRYQYKSDWLLEDHLNIKDETIEIIVPAVPNNIAAVAMIFINSFRLNLRQIQYINITLEEKNIIKLLFNVLSGARAVHKYYLRIDVFYSTHPSNIKGRQYDVEMIDMYHTGTIERHGFYSVYLHQYECQ